MNYADLIVVDVDSITVRDMGGEGSQVELVLARAGRRATVAIRVVARRGRVLRITDLRRRDKRTRAAKNLTTVPMEEIR